MGFKVEDKIAQFWRHLKAAFVGFGRDNMYVYAGNMAFIGMLAVFPFLILLIALSGTLGETDTGYQAIQFAYENLPDNVVAQIQGPINMVVSETSGNLLTFSILIALWTAVRGTSAARSATMKAYGVKYRKRTHALFAFLIDLGLVIGAVVLILITLFVLVTGPAVIETIEKWFESDLNISQHWGVSRYIISPLVLFFTLFSLYFLFVPNYEKKTFYHAPGALLALIIWFLMAAAFSFYLRYMGELSLLYGSLTGVIILQLFLFLLSIGFLLGAELNAAYTNETNPGAARKKQKTLKPKKESAK